MSQRPDCGRPAGVAALAALGVLAGVAVALAEPDPRAGRHRPDSFLDTVDCSACHTPSSWGLTTGGTGRGFDHSRTGFPLTGMHRQAACVACHSSGGSPGRECASCHDDPHQSRLGDGCDGCHSASSWSATRAIERHQTTLLPLTGMHSLIDCASCHRRTAERTWSSVPARCFACHEDDYRRSDVHPDHQGGDSHVPFPRDCGACHRSSSWTPAFIDPLAVSRSSALAVAPRHDVRFPISFGAHRGLSCESCHLGRRAPRGVDCRGCHAHAPSLLRAQHPGRRLPLDGSGCLHCHPGGVVR